MSSASSDSGQAGAPSGAQLDHIHQTSSTDLSAALSYNFQIKYCESYQAAFDAVNPIPDICHGRHGHVRVKIFWLV